MVNGFKVPLVKGDLGGSPKVKLITSNLYRNFFSGELAQLSISEYHVKVLVFDPEQEVIVQWND
jgi:hypothetical protein